jgi:hypothetical protein
VTVFLFDETLKCILHATSRPWRQNAFLLGESQGFSDFWLHEAGQVLARDLGSRPQKGRRGPVSGRRLAKLLMLSSCCAHATKKG